MQLRNGEGGLDAPRAPASRQGCGPPRIIGRSLAGAIHDQELVFQEKRLRDQGTDATRSEQPGQRGDQVDNKNGQIAHRRIVAGWEILRNYGRITIRQAQLDPRGLTYYCRGFLLIRCDPWFRMPGFPRAPLLALLCSGMLPRLSFLSRIMPFLPFLSTPT